MSCLQVSMPGDEEQLLGVGIHAMQSLYEVQYGPIRIRTQHLSAAPRWGTQDVSVW